MRPGETILLVLTAVEGFSLTMTSGLVHHIVKPLQNANLQQRIDKHFPRVLEPPQHRCIAGGGPASTGRASRYAKLVVNGPWKPSKISFRRTDTSEVLTYMLKCPASGDWRLFVTGFGRHSRAGSDSHLSPPLRSSTYFTNGDTGPRNQQHDFRSRAPSNSQSRGVSPFRFIQKISTAVHQSKNQCDDWEENPLQQSTQFVHHCIVKPKTSLERGGPVGDSAVADVGLGVAAMGSGQTRLEAIINTNCAILPGKYYGGE